MTNPPEPTDQPQPNPTASGQQPPQQPYGYGQQPPSQPPYGQPPYGQQPPYNQQPYRQPTGPGSIDPAQERLLAGAAHWGALLAGFFSSGALAWLVPLAIMMLKGNDSPFVRAQAVESLNFQISALIYGAVSVVLAILTLGLGLILVLAVGVWWMVFTIIAAIAANEGRNYRYPMTLRFVS